jgi:hypothetical protein
MPSSEEKNRWVRRWRYVMAPTSRPGIWRLKIGHGQGDASGLSGLAANESASLEFGSIARP